MKNGHFRLAAAALFVALLAATPASAKPPAPIAARTGLDLAWAAARAWATDAELVYVENDEDVDAAGAAARWGYLFVSPSGGRARAWSVREGRIAAAENVEMALEAPPLPASWIDSDAALAAADREAGRAFRNGARGHLSTMLLMRGAFDESDPDRTTWTLVYTAPGAPSLWVVVDAAEGKVRRTWRG
jgi:hypothetical protein